MHLSARGSRARAATWRRFLRCVESGCAWLAAAVQLLANMPNTVRAPAYALVVALAGASFAARGGSSGDADAGASVSKTRGAPAAENVGSTVIDRL